MLVQSDLRVDDSGGELGSPLGQGSTKGFNLKEVPQSQKCIHTFRFKLDGVVQALLSHKMLANLAQVLDDVHSERL